MIRDCTVPADARESLNRLAREQMKHKLLADIRTDLAVCEIEGWRPREYLAELHSLIAHFDPCPSSSVEVGARA